MLRTAALASNCRTPRVIFFFKQKTGYEIMPSLVGSEMCIRDSTGIVFVAAGHTTGWPIAAGGAQSLTNALASYLHSLGSRILLNADIQTLADLPAAAATLFDTSVSSLMRIAGTALTPSYLQRLSTFQ